MQQSHTIR